MTEKVANKREPVPDYKVWPCVDELLVHFCQINYIKHALTIVINCPFKCQSILCKVGPDAKVSELCLVFLPIH